MFSIDRCAYIAAAQNVPAAWTASLSACKLFDSRACFRLRPRTCEFFGSHDTSWNQAEFIAGGSAVHITGRLLWVAARMRSSTAILNMVHQTGLGRMSNTVLLTQAPAELQHCPGAGTICRMSLQQSHEACSFSDLQNLLITSASVAAIFALCSLAAAATDGAISHVPASSDPRR